MRLHFTLKSVKKNFISVILVAQFNYAENVCYKFHYMAAVLSLKVVKDVHKNKFFKWNLCKHVNMLKIKFGQQNYILKCTTILQQILISVWSDKSYFIPKDSFGFINNKPKESFISANIFNCSWIYLLLCGLIWLNLYI